MSCKHCGLTIRGFAPNKDFCTKNCMEDFLFQEELKQQKVIGQCFECGGDIAACDDFNEDEWGGKTLKFHTNCYRKKAGVA